MGGASGFGEETKVEVAKPLHSIVRPAGTAQSGCKKTKDMERNANIGPLQNGAQMFCWLLS